MDFIRGSVVVFWLLFSSWVSAGTVSGIYSTQLVVGEPATEPSPMQIETGLRQVLIKVSGNSAISSNPVIQGQLPNAVNLLQQFSFKDTEQGSVILQLDYAQSLVDALVSQTGMKPLGIQRPTVLFWLATDLQKEQDYVMPEDKVVNTLRDVAATRALPVQFPLLDLTDQSSLPVADLWGLFEESIESASLRYRPDAVVAARLSYRDSGQVQLEWLFNSVHGSKRLSGLGSDEQVIEEMVNAIADQLFKPVASHKLSHFQTGVEVHFSNISSLADYVQLAEFLKSLPVVNSANTERVQGDLLVMRLELDSSEEQMLQAISVEPRLTLQNRDIDNQGRTIFSYRWQN